MATLRQTSQSLLARARADEGKAFRCSLPRGLVEEVQQLPNGDVKLVLTRLNVAPGDNEWATVIKHWPERVPDGVVPERRTEGRVHKLIGHWPRPIELIETAG